MITSFPPGLRSELDALLPLGPGLGLWLVVGLAAGVAHFALLRWNATLYVSGSLGRALTVQFLRMGATTLLLGFAAWHGALPLLVTTIGVFLARATVLRVLAAAP